MANTSPVADTAGVVEQVWRLGREAGLVDVQPIGAVTVGLAGEQLAELGAMADSAAAGPDLLRRRALRRRPAADAPRAGVRQGVRRGRSPSTPRSPGSPRARRCTRARSPPGSGLTGWPAVAEEAIIARDVLLAEHVGARLHVCHVSTAGSVEIAALGQGRGASG